MKKYIACVTLGFVLSEIHTLHREGFLRRIKDVTKHIWEHRDDPADFNDFNLMVEYIAQQRSPFRNEDRPNHLRAFQVQFDYEQYVTVEMALRSLSAGDPESQDENEALIRQFYASTREIW